MSTHTTPFPSTTQNDLISPAEAAPMLSSDRGAVRLLDVRTPGEYRTAHIAGSYNVPMDVLAGHAAQIRGLDTPVVLISESGQRAGRADAVLRASGMGHVHVLDGGLRAWIDAGLPVNRGVQPMSLERQVRIGAGALAATGAVLALLVSPLFAVIPAFVGTGLVVAGVTDTCGMGTLLAKLPYNRASTCDVTAVIRALREGQPADAGAPTRRAQDVSCCG